MKKKAMTKDQVAKCQLKTKYNYGDEQKLKRCDKCDARFTCFSTRFDPKDVRLAHHLFAVPNTKEGMEWLEKAKEYLNDETYRFSKMGRAKDRKKKGGNGQHIAPSKSDWIALYITQSPLARAIGDELKGLRR